MTNTTSDEIDKILSGFGIFARWHGFDEAMDTKGEHTSSTPTEAQEQAKAAVQRLIVSERLDEVKNIYADNVFTTQTGIGVQDVVISQAFDSRINELQAQLDNEGGSDENT